MVSDIMDRQPVSDSGSDAPVTQALDEFFPPLPRRHGCPWSTTWAALRRASPVSAELQSATQDGGEGG